MPLSDGGEAALFGEQGPETPPVIFEDPLQRSKGQHDVLECSLERRTSSKYV